MKDKEVYINSMVFDNCIKETCGVAASLDESNKFVQPIFSQFNSGTIEVQSAAINEFKDILRLTARNIELYREIALKTLDNADKAMEYLKNTDVDAALQLDKILDNNKPQIPGGKSSTSNMQNGKHDISILFPDNNGMGNGSPSFPGANNGNSNKTKSFDRTPYSIFDFENGVNGSM